MLTSKQRAELKGLANPLECAFQIGKGGVSEEQARQIDNYLAAHELIKIKVLENSLLTAREAAEDIAGRINAEVVQCIGSKAVLYKRNQKKPIITLKSR